jgi:hypothetical protein
MSTNDPSLSGGGDCQAHWHSADRVPTQDFLHGLQVTGRVVTVGSSVSLRGAEDLVLVDTTAGDITLTLPRARNGREVTVLKTSALNKLTIQGTDGQLINGRMTQTYYTRWTARTLKAVGNTWRIVHGATFDKAPHGAFYSLQTQAALVNTPTLVTLNGTAYSSGTSHVIANGIHVTQAGLYNLQFSVQVTNMDSQARRMSLWLRKTGTQDIAASASTISVPSTHGGIAGHYVLAANFFVDLGVSDYIELWWATDSTTVRLETLAAQTTPFVQPASPAVMVTLNYVSSETANG